MVWFRDVRSPRIALACACVGVGVALAVAVRVASVRRADYTKNDDDDDDDGNVEGEDVFVPSDGLNTRENEGTSSNASDSLREFAREEAAACAYCRRERSTRRCERCRATFYCSKRCQSAHWRNGHGEECELDENMDDVRAMYHEAVRVLSTWDADRGYAPVVDMFRRIMARAAQVGDSNLECEAALIIAEIEINSIRRAYAVHESARVRGGIDAAQFERITSATLKLAYHNNDKISEARAHIAVGDYYSLAVGDHEAAVEHYGLAREYAREEEMLPVETEACRRMRWTQSIRGDIDSAALLSAEVLRLTRAYINEQHSEDTGAEDLGAALDESGSGSSPTVPMILREHWYLGGYENQEIYALKEHGCALRGERRFCAPPLVIQKYQPAAVAAFEEALVKLDKYWSRHGLDADSDADGAYIKRLLYAHLADLYDNYLVDDANDNADAISRRHTKAVDYRRAYEAMAPGSFGAAATCALCVDPLGGLSIDDGPIAMTCAWDSCARTHHFHAKCFSNVQYSNGLFCPACP